MAGFCFPDHRVCQACVANLIDRAVDLHGEELINDHIKTSSGNVADLDKIRGELLGEVISDENREFLGKASRVRKAGWFKSVTWMEGVARDIVGPTLDKADEAFQTLIHSVFEWSAGGPA